MARDSEVLLSKGYGSANLEWNIPNGPTTKFRFGSITKQFTAASILFLEEQGKLKIEDPIRKYLPEAPPAWDKITIYHVLTHTSGIPSITNSPEFQKMEHFPLTPVQHLDWLKNKPLEFMPGEKWNYSNSGFVVLGYLIEKVSNQTYQDFIQKNIFTPLGMKDSGYDSNTEIIPRRANGYSPGPHGPQNEAFVHMSTPFSAGALYSTTEDLMRWESGLFGGKLLSRESLAKMTTPFKNNYGLGVSVDTPKGHKRISHGGGIQGFNAYLAYFPDTRIMIAVLGNLNGDAPQQIGDTLGLLAHGEAVVLPSEKKEITLSPETLQQYVGIYDLGQMAPNLKMVIRVESNHLTAQASGGVKTTLFASSSTKFFHKVADDDLEFFKDDKGKVTSFRWTQNQGRRVTIAPKISDEVPQYKEIALDPAILAQYAGVYRLAPGVDVTMTLEGTQLFTQITGQQKFSLFAESDTKFFLKVVEATVEFVKDEKGAVSHILMSQGGNENVARRTDYKKEAAAIDGTWAASVKGPDGNPLEVTYVFEQLGKTLVGTVSTKLGGGPFSEGKIEGNNISFVVRTPQFTVQTTGTLSGDEVRITQKNGDDVTQFTASRVRNK